MKWYDNDDAKGVNFLQGKFHSFHIDLWRHRQLSYQGPCWSTLTQNVCFWFSCPLFCFKFYIFSFFCVRVVRGCDMC